MFGKILEPFSREKTPGVYTSPVTKFFIPPISANYLERPRLEFLQNQILAYKLTLITAPAGYGKTTFISHFIINQKQPVAWISLDNRDNDFGQFWTNVISAIQSICPGFADFEEQILKNNEKQFEIALTGLISAIQDSIPNLIMVFSGYHNIQSKSVHEAVAFFMEFLPPNAHLILSSREDPALPLVRLQALGYLLKISAADLRFNLTETASYLLKIRGLSLTEEEVNQIYIKTA